MRTTPPTIRPVKHRSPADDCAWVDHVRCQPQTLYNSTELQDGLGTDLNVYTIGTVWNICDWPQKSYNVSGAGTHSLMWQYIKDNRTADGSDRGWVDYLQWTPGAGGASTGVACPELADWDGDQAIGGPRPTLHHANRQSSIRNHQSEAVYEYDVYGQPAAADPGHPNRFMFTGREFDKDTGLYYYRARYYNPTIGRVLQTDPIGYDDGMNWYAYCRNNPLRFTDPSGTTSSAAINPWVLVGREIDAYAAAFNFCPDYPGTWTSKMDFLRWWFLSSGRHFRDVDLKLVGLLDDFRADPAVSPQIERVQKEAISVAKIVARYVADAESGSYWYYRFDVPIHVQYDFAPGIGGTAGGLITDGPLWVLGNGTLTANVRIEAARTPLGANCSVRIHWQVDDWFREPFSLFDKWYLDWITSWLNVTGEDYRIFANWEFDASGTVLNEDE